MGQRVFNFSPGPAMLPREVMEQAQAEFLDWQGSGMSAMEVSHRSPTFLDLAEKIRQDLRQLLSIPKTHEILLLQGGAQQQFAAVPLNLAADNTQVAYAVTGVWSQLAYQEAKRYCEVTLAVDMSSDDFKGIAPQSAWQAFDQTSYLYYCDNETVNGVEFSAPPTSAVPLVCDMTSSILTKSIDFDRHGVVIAGSQKNLGPAGVTLVIIHRDLLARQPMSFTPTIMQYQAQFDKGSMYNTPVTYAWYLLAAVVGWTLKEGGLCVMQDRAVERSQKLYQFIDQSDFYQNDIDSAYRSRLNIPFTLRDESRQADFLRQAEEAGLTHLKGHRLVGGLRASLYNAMPMEGVERLVAFMANFEKAQ